MSTCSFIKDLIDLYPFLMSNDLCDAYCYNYRCVQILLPELWPPEGSLSWQAPHGCTHLGSGTSQRHAPARAAGRWWRWCGCACASSWAGLLCPTPETCLHRSRHTSLARSVPHHTCSRISWCLFRAQEKIRNAIFHSSSLPGFFNYRDSEVHVWTLL